MVDRRGEAEGLRPHDDASQGHPERPEHVDDGHEAAADVDDAMADLDHRRHRAALARRLRRDRFALGAVDLAVEPLEFRRQADQPRLAATRLVAAQQAVEERGAERIELAQPGNVDRQCRRLARHGPDQLFERMSVDGRPRPARGNLQAIAAHTAQKGRLGRQASFLPAVESAPLNGAGD